MCIRDRYSNVAELSLTCVYVDESTGLYSIRYCILFFSTEFTNKLVELKFATTLADVSVSLSTPTPLIFGLE